MAVHPSIYLYMFYEDAIDGTVLRVVRPLAYLVSMTEGGTGRLPMYACQACPACQANMESKINVEANCNCTPS